MRHPRIVLAAVVLIVSIVAACTEVPVEPNTPLAPTPNDTSLQVNSLAPASDAPVIANPVVSFYAVAGDSRQAFMYYRSRPGRTDSTVFIRFRVSNGSLLARPDGSPFADGDSILITMTLIDPEKLIVRFAPSGLQFDPLDPADIKFNFLETDDDLDDDGAITPADSTFTSMLAIWKRENANEPWFKQASILSTELHEIEADVTGFTEYIIAW
ncbi:MAG: hypothetical protein IT357_04805 [Gemmatimonadaceae bacterium]|nr:hypothetical protein [Gemmatimonadaceae bacterium]